jgi:YfiR/HmsC-like
MGTHRDCEIGRFGTWPTLLRLGSAMPLLALLFSLHLVNALRGHAQDALPEYQVKAAYLFNFFKFVEWPQDSFGNPTTPVVIGVVGEDPFGTTLPVVIAGKTVQGRELIVRKYYVGEDLRGAHILFISASEKKRLPAILLSLRGSFVLTVSDVDGFLDQGGMIQFVNENDRIRFAINLSATNQAKLKMSSKLLSLAKVVEEAVKEGAK